MLEFVVMGRYKELPMHVAALHAVEITWQTLENRSNTSLPKHAGIELGTLHPCDRQ